MTKKIISGKPIIAPSLLSADFLRLAEEVKAAEAAGAGLHHVDVMDGRFVPNITIGPFVVEAIKKAASIPLDVHLMIEEPERYLEDFITAGADYLTVHAEATIHLDRVLNRIRELGALSGVSINPSTPVSSLENVLYAADMVLIMSVNPGFGGQAFIPNSLNKTKELKAAIKKAGSKTMIEVDGGIKPGNAAQVVKAGADVLVMGSAFYNSGNYKKTVEEVMRSVSGKRR